MKKGRNPDKATLISKRRSMSETGYGRHRFYTGQEEKLRLSKSGGLVCEKCGAVSYKKYWFVPDKKKDDLLVYEKLSKTLCPGCQRIKDQNFQGEVILDGKSLLADSEAIAELIKHTEGKCWHYNPASKIASISVENDRIKIETTTKWLAIRIGKEIFKSHKGKLEIKPSIGEDFVRVYWKNETH